jgi:hypothetical protein
MAKRVEHGAHRSVEFARATGAAPPEVREEARLILQDLSDSLEAFPEDSVFWESIGERRLCLEVRGWSFYYGFEGDTLLVNEVRAKDR